MKMKAKHQYLNQVLWRRVGWNMSLSYLTFSPCILFLLSFLALLMDKFLETDREVFTQFCTDGKIVYLQCFQAYRKRNNCVSATGNDMCNTSSASVAKEIKSQKYFTKLYWKSLTFPLVMIINNVHLSGLGKGILRSSELSKHCSSLPSEKLNYSCMKLNTK